tara:strand:+ start:218 stop:343 length:126 start_codon:yes stop_codon:yes gene_type:complete
VGVPHARGEEPKWAAAAAVHERIGAPENLFSLLHLVNPVYF